MIIEVDGGQHAEQKQYDEKRDHGMSSQGFRVLRFWDHEVLTNINGVLEKITVQISPSPRPSRQGRGND
jgi:very-short-patch-repair endonuclease